MTIQIMNCCDDKIDVDIGELSEISEISVLVLSGDEILKVWKKDGSTLKEDSDRHGRHISFYDGEYRIYDSEKGINKIDEWVKRKDSNEWVM